MTELRGRDWHKKEQADLLSALKIRLRLAWCLMNVQEGNFMYPPQHKKALKILMHFTIYNEA